MSQDESSPSRRRERSARYPGVPLADAIELVRFLDERGLDGLPASEIALALGYKNVKTNTFSARLSSARQFGLLTLSDEGYGLTGSARALIHPVNPDDPARLKRQLFLEPPLYADLAERLEGKRVPEPAILANLLYHHYQITASAKQAAADAFLQSARDAGVLGEDGVFRTEAPSGSASLADSGSRREQDRPLPVVSTARSKSTQGKPAEVRLDLKLWDQDRGKTIRVRAPESISRASFERFLQAFRLLVRIDDGPVEPDASS